MLDLWLLSGVSLCNIVKRLIVGWSLEKGEGERERERGGGGEEGKKERESERDREIEREIDR